MKATVEIVHEDGDFKTTAKHEAKDAGDMLFILAGAIQDAIPRCVAVIAAAVEELIDQERERRGDECFDGEFEMEDNLRNAAHALVRAWEKHDEGDRQ